MKHVLIIGQAPPLKDCSIPFGRTRLYKWFEEIGIEKKEVLRLFDFDALVDTFPGTTNKGHKLPLDSEIRKHIPEIIKKIHMSNIKVIVPVGKHAIECVFNQKNIQLSDCIGKEFHQNPFGMGESITIIPLPHPSGASTWQFNSNNKQLLIDALELIKSHI